MKEIQGYIAIVPNDPSGKGLLYFTELAAITHAKTFDGLVERHWDDPNSTMINRQHWVERPQPVKIFTLAIKEEIKWT